MKELVILQKRVIEAEKAIKALELKHSDLETRLGKEVVELKMEATNVLNKASALVNPYSSNTMKFGD